MKAGDEWIYYKVWEMKDEFLEDKRGKGVDVVYVHGKPLYLGLGDCRNVDFPLQAIGNTGKWGLSARLQCRTDRLFPSTTADDTLFNARRF